MSKLEYRPRVSPLGSVVRGLAAGIVGTGLMTAAQELAARLQAKAAGDAGPAGEDQSAEPKDPWEEASAPAKVAKRVVEGVFQKQLSADPTVVTNVMHWAYGTGWGAVYGLIAGTRGTSTLKQGARFGTGVWAMSYVQLVPMGLYELPWTYPPKDTALEVSYHVAYGVGAGLGYAMLDR